MSKQETGDVYFFGVPQEQAVGGKVCCPGRRCFLSNCLPIGEAEQMASEHARDSGHRVGVERTRTTSQVGEILNLFRQP